MSSTRPANHHRARADGGQRTVNLQIEYSSGTGYCRIHGELAGLSITVAASTLSQILKSAGIDPAPRWDGPGWPEFLRSRAQGILALDFFTADLLNGAKILRLGRNRAWHPPRPVLGATEHRSGPGSCSRHGTCSWTWKMPGSG